MKSDKQCRIFRLCSFILPILILLSYFVRKDITPFGDNTFLIHDMNAQYIGFFAYFRTVLEGKNNFLYSLSRGLGGDFPSFFAYYLSSPLNLIILLFPDQLMPIGISLEMLLLFGLTGAACYYSLAYFAEGRNPLLLLFLSIAYSLSGWMLLNAENFQFIPEAVILPMLITALQKMKDTGKMLPAIIWLSLSVIVNFYIGYMIFIFSFLWMIIPDGHQVRKKYLLIFPVSAVISSPIWIPVLVQMGTTIKSVDPQWYRPLLNFSILEFLKKFLPGQFDNIQYRDNGLPAVYCSLLSLGITILYFFIEDDKRTKRHRIILLAIMFVSLIFKPLTMAWQGFSSPHWWPYRFSFLFIYLLILCASGIKMKIPWFLLPLGLAGLIYNLDVTFNVKLQSAQTLSSYSQAITEKRDLLSGIDQDKEFFRIEDMNPRSDNDAMQFAYAGITNFDSLADRRIFEFLRNMGFSQDRYTVQYGSGNTYFANALLGVRYILDHGEVREIVPNAVPAFILFSDERSDPDGSLDPADYQNRLAFMLGSPDNIINPVDITEIEKENVDCDEIFCWKIDPEKDAFFTFDLKIPEKSRLYAQVDMNFLVGRLFIVTEDREIAFSQSDRLIPLVTSDTGADYTVSIRMDSNISDFPKAQFFAENIVSVHDMFDYIYDDIHVLKESSSELTVHMKASDSSNRLVITIPYDKRWRASAGGEQLETEPFLNTFLSVTVPAGTEDLRLNYR